MRDKANSFTGTLIRLGEADNVLVASGPVTAGQAMTASGEELQVAKPVTLGHKLAARDIRKDEKIVKYGVSIGSATEDIPAGMHVHVHNMKSDYTATHSLTETAKGDRDA